MRLPRHIRKAIRLQEGALTAWLDQKFPDRQLSVEYDTRPVEVTPKDEEHNTGTSEQVTPTALDSYPDPAKRPT